MIPPQPGSTVDRLTQAMLERIRNVELPVGSLIPSERALMKEFGVSRIALREALSKLRALGVLDTEHGRGSVVRRLDSSAITQLFPLLLALDGEQTVEQMFEMRQALESRTASYAALRRTDDEAVEILRLAGLFAPRWKPGRRNRSSPIWSFTWPSPGPRTIRCFPTAWGW